MWKPGFKFSFSDSKPQTFKIILHLYLCCFVGLFFLQCWNISYLKKSCFPSITYFGYICIQQWLAPISFQTQNKPRLPADWSLLVVKTRCFLINCPHFSSGFHPAFPHHGPSSFQLQLYSQFYSQINTIN